MLFKLDKKPNHCFSKFNYLNCHSEKLYIQFISWKAPKTHVTVFWGLWWFHSIVIGCVVNLYLGVYINFQCEENVSGF